jgi:hypothetical protein
MGEGPVDVVRGRDHAFQQVNGPDAPWVCGICGGSARGHREPDAEPTPHHGPVMSAFLEADARGAGAHGNGVGFAESAAEVMARLEAKVDALILALRAGAVGRWQP